MDALQVSGVMPATRDAAEKTTVTAATAPLNLMAPEFVPAVGAATAAALNPLAREFVPVGALALNPLARDFVPLWGGLPAGAPEVVVMPPALYYHYQAPPVVGYPAAAAYELSNAIPPRTWIRRARFSQRVQRIHKEEFVRRTIHITNIDHTVTEEMLAELFGRCGMQVVDCRLCGDPISGFRFAFIEFSVEEDALNALNLNGARIGLFPLKIVPSRTAIMPIKHSLLPQSEEEKERSSRTIYCTNIDKTVTPAGLKSFCEAYFGSVSRVRLLGHDDHATQIAFIEFEEASGAIVALSSSCVYEDGLPIRVSPSKTPIRASVYDKPRRT